MKPMNKTLQPLRGYTTVELMVSMTILVILAGAAAGVFNQSQDLLNWNYNSVSLQKELRRTLDVMSREIRESSPTSPGGILPVTVTPGVNRFSFQIPSAISGNSVTSWTQINYALTADNRVTRTVDNEAPIAIGSDVQSLTCVYPLNLLTAPRTVQIQINGRRTALERTVTATLTGEVTLRNP